MSRLSSLSRTGLFGSLIIILTFMTPIGAFADSSSSTCTPPSGGQGVNKPVGADAGTYTYNCTTGMWQNQYYTFNPANGVVTPNFTSTYTYNPSTGLYDTTTYIYNAPKGTYDPATVSVATPPAGADVIGGPVAVTPSDTPDSTDGSSISNTGPDSTNTIAGDNTGTIDGTGPDSTNTLGGVNNNDTNVNDNTNASIDNGLTSDSTTGDAAVIGNTTAGGATTGDAQAVANEVNLLQSSSSALGGNALTFVANVNGDVDGDLLINPADLSNVQSATDPSTAGTTNNNLTVNNDTNEAIDNNLNLGATSGAATVASNTTGGDATSGSADTIADVVNLIDSAINSGQSFVGVVNINGDLNGNILIPDTLVNQLVADNVPTVSISTTGPGSQNTITGGSSNNTNVTNTNNEGITNNVDSSANTGGASVTNNTTAGNATTGDASTNLTAFNLTGSNVIGANDLLVFVNVLGTWVGMILNAPAGATAAELGGGITSNTTTPDTNNNTNVDSKTNQNITNNINSTANSGNATVADNTTGGNATSGNAGTAVNLLNVEGSTLSLSGWFGLLFINVFGTWNGDLGTYNPATYGTSASTGTGGSASPSAASNGSAGAARVFRFVPTGSSGNTGSGTFSIVSAGGGNGSGTNGSAVLASSVKVTPTNNNAPTPKLQSSHRDILLPLTAGVLCAAYLIGDGVLSHRKRRNAANAVK